MTLQEFKNISDADYQKLFDNLSTKIIGKRNDKIIAKYSLRCKTVAEKLHEVIKELGLEKDYNYAVTTKSHYFDLYKGEKNLEIRVSNHTQATVRVAGSLVFNADKDDALKSFNNNHLSVDCAALLMSESEIINLVKEHFA